MIVCRLLAAVSGLLTIAFFALLPGGLVLADIWGYVDERGVPHLSNVQVDHRYYLFKKEPRETPPPEPDAMTNSDPAPALQRTTSIDPARRKAFAPLISAVARAHRLDPALLHAVIAVESGYDPGARSPKGAIGLMQLMPDTAARYRVRDIWNPEENLAGGARYLRDLLRLFDDDLNLVLAAYNAGEAAVIQYGNRVPPYPETRNYVPRVLQHYRLYRNAGRW
jgi:soluble lytic murein transglycosylase-like protein